MEIFSFFSADFWQTHALCLMFVSADDVKEHKPHPETFLRCAELIQANPSRCIVFEDADLGVQAGLNAGMDVFDVRSREIISPR